MFQRWLAMVLIVAVFAISILADGRKPKPLQPAIPMAVSIAGADRIVGFDEEKEAVLAFVQAWARHDRKELERRSEPYPLLRKVLDDSLDSRYSYHFTEMSGPLTSNERGEVCLGVKYQIKESAGKEERDAMSAVCVHPNGQGQKLVYMID